MNAKTFLLTVVALLFAAAQALALVDEELHPGPQVDSQPLPATVTELPIVRTIALPGTWPYGLAFDGTAVWHTDGDTDTIYRLDPADGTVLDSTPSPASHPTGLAWYDGNITQWHGLWNCDYGMRIYHVVSPLHSIPAPGGSPNGVVWIEDTLWASYYGNNQLHQIDPSDGHILATMPAPGTSIRGMTMWNGDLWVVDSGAQHSDAIYHLDPADGTVLAQYLPEGFETGDFMCGLTAVGNELWVVEKYSLQVLVLTLDCPPPPEPSNPDPCDGATGIPFDTLLSWGGPGPGCDLIDGFEDGDITEYIILSGDTHFVSTAAAHDGTFGLEDSNPDTAASWIYRNDSAAQVAQGDTISYWVQFRDTGRIYCGFAASTAGTYSLVAADNTNEIIIMLNENFDYVHLANTPQTWMHNKWYRMEVQWGIGGLITGRLYDSDGTTLLNSITTSDNTYTHGGIAFRGFDRVYQDTIEYCTSSAPLTAVQLSSGDSRAKVVPSPNPANAIGWDKENEAYILDDSAQEPGIRTGVELAPAAPGPGEDELPAGLSIHEGMLVESQGQDEGTTTVFRDSVSSSPLATGATLINFDDVSAPCGFRNTVRLTNEYAALGIVFEGPGGNDGGAILDECSNFGVSGHSSPNFLGFNNDSSLSDGGTPRGPETMHFNPRVTQVQALVGSSSGAGQIVTMEAYNDDGFLVDSATVTLAPMMSPIAVSGGGIRQVVVWAISSVHFVLDDLQFSPEGHSEDYPVIYDVYFGTDCNNLELICQDVNEPNCDPTPELNQTLSPNTTYYWQVVAKNECGQTEGPCWSFTTERAPNESPWACIVGFNDQRFECAGPSGTTVTLDGSCSIDVDSTPGTNDDIVEFNWYEVDCADLNSIIFLASGEIINYIFGVGEHAVIVEVIDKAGASDTEDVTIAVEDSTPPVITCPPDITLECPADTNVSATGSAAASDTCGSVTVEHSDTWEPACGNTGTLTRTWTAIDDWGNSSSCAQTITVIDTTPPTINTLSVTPGVLWPPSHKMVEVDVTADFHDLSDPEPVCRIVNVTSNEPVNSIGDGSTEPDWEITGDLTVSLRAESAGTGTGRLYTLHIECTDTCGNIATATVEVTVPHDKRKPTS